MNIRNIDQPAKDWLADNLQNFARLVESGGDPSVIITMTGGVVLELRLNECPGLFSRQTVTVELAAPAGKDGE